MKKVLATVVSALAAVSFAGIVMAADMPAGGDTSASPNATAGQPAGQGADQRAKPVKKHKKMKKHHKKHGKKAMKKGAASTGSQAPTSQGEVSPVTPSAPGAK
jgi:hypothetical protein